MWQIRRQVRRVRVHADLARFDSPSSSGLWFDDRLFYVHYECLGTSILKKFSSMWKPLITAQHDTSSKIRGLFHRLSGQSWPCHLGFDLVLDLLTKFAAQTKWQAAGSRIGAKLSQTWNAWHNNHSRLILELQWGFGATVTQIVHMPWRKLVSCINHMFVYERGAKLVYYRSN